MSMYRQLWLAIIASMLLALGGGLLASLLSARGYLESQLAIKNTDNAVALALSLSQSNPDPVTVDLVTASLFDSGHYELVRVIDPQGAVIAQRKAPEGDLDAPAWFVRLLPIHSVPGQAQISNGWKQFGTVTLISHSRFAYGALWKSAYEMTLALSLAGLVGGCLGSLVLRRLRKPLMTVIDQAAAITQRRFVTVDLPRVPELRQLAVAMNDTVGRLKSMFEDEASRLEQMRKEANFDALTGLVNRTHFLARLRHTLEAEDSAGGTLFLLRLNDLSGINRRLGREPTDSLLKLSAEVITKSVSELGSVVARLNGADFAVLAYEGVDGRGVSSRLMESLDQAASPYMGGARAASIGYGKFSRNEDIGSLLARIDAALATAEIHSGSGVQEALSLQTKELPRSTDQWAKLIALALKNRWVRLISFPVVNVSGEMSHKECPLRLMFDEAGEWVPAGRFLPVAERLKLTPDLDLMAISLGLDELERAPDLVGLAINLSASSLESPSFLNELLAALARRSSVAPRLWLEVPEEGALKHLESFRALCTALKKLGCRIGLEHFGHRFSQIGQLHDLGLDYLKVDSSFVRGVDANPGNEAFLKGLCSIAHNIGLQVIAEGVSTSSEFIALKAIGFDAATGPGIQT
ncbi:EAL domain-containing protein [Rhodoferax mekongensis]|uniref:EAL domain-containing protein n=1 Tax=Rhodoferax mekongensis TaxID=3068341 RepID=UPI0028BE0A9E|nr:EAL domain-containing protein [Rhodoferax sp. TBRC 17199]MDT7513500.1 EAL domain-containing protein [Rhodoferax sp. TBRC 17199]